MRGMKNLLMVFCMNPEFVPELMNTIAICNIAQVEKARQFNIDAIELGDDWGQQTGLIDYRV